MGKIKTSEKILNCATQLFAQFGFDGTIMDDLAEQCGVNKASIYYHHKDKATLYDHVLTALFTPIAESMGAAVEAETDPVKMLEAHIKTFAKSNEEQPHFTAIVMRELATGGRTMPAQARVQMQRLPKLLKNILETGVEQKRFRDTDPLVLHFMIVGAINLFVASIPMRRSLPASDGQLKLRNSDIDAAAEQVYQTILASLLL